MIQAVIISFKFWPILLVLLPFVLLSVIFSINTCYCYVFEHKSWVLWKKVCKVLPYAEFISYSNWDEYQYPGLENYRFYIQNPDEDGGLEVVYWVKQDCVSVHKWTDECVLSDFDKYHSTKAAKIIKNFLL